MPDNTLILLRHAEATINGEIATSKWELSPKGKEQATTLALDKYLQDVQIIISSSEKKAIETVKQLAKKLELDIQIFEELNELNRDNGEFCSQKEYNENVKSIFEKPKIVVNDWETANDALERFSAKLVEIDNRYTNKKILLVSHGIVLNLYFAQILNKKQFLFQRWSTKKFCDYGIIENNTVVKDIASRQQEIYEFK